MTDIFTTREIATGIWFILFLAFIFISPSTRKAAIRVIIVAVSKKLVIPFIAILVYATILTFLSMQLPIWRNVFLKDIIFWVLFAGVPVCYGAVNPKKESHYFRNILTDNLKFTIILEFIISSFTFNLIVEIIILPVVTLLVILETAAGYNSENQPVKRLISFILAIFGYAFLGLTLKIAVETYSMLDSIDLLVSFCIPIIFSIAYILECYRLAGHKETKQTPPFSMYLQI